MEDFNVVADLKRASLAFAKSGIIEIFSLLSQLTRLNKPIALCFHRVVDDHFKFTGVPSDRLCVTAHDFQSIIEFLQDQSYEFVNAEVFAQSYTINFMEKICTVTFDDGYIDNLNIALPICRNLKVPLSIFYSPALRLGLSLSWWYDIESVFFNSTYSNHLKLKSYLLLRDSLLEVSTKSVPSILAQKNIKSSCFKHLYFDINSIPDNLGSDLYIYNHTFSHMCLASHSQDEIESDLHLFNDFCKDSPFVNQSVFAYPYGHRGSFNPSHISLLKASGIKYAYSCEPYLISGCSPSFSIPRLTFASYLTKSHLRATLFGLPRLLRRHI